MSQPKGLTIFAEGKGDLAAVPALAKRVLRDLNGQDVLFVDPASFHVRSVAQLVKNDCAKWHGWLHAAGKRQPPPAAVLLVLDGDAGQVPSDWATYGNFYHTFNFCAAQSAIALGRDAQAAGAGRIFSLASVFVVMEFETWLLAGVESLRGCELAEGRGVVPKTANCPAGDLEKIRDAKGRLRSIIPRYSPTLDQRVLAKEVDLHIVEKRCRSFRRFYSAMRQLIDAVRHDSHVITPMPPSRVG